jgi:hypothetical protein
MLEKVVRKHDLGILKEERHAQKNKSSKSKYG